MKAKVLFLALVCLPLMSFSQEDKKAEYQKKREEIKVQKVAFITEKVNFTPEEAQVFWPLYNELEAKKSELTKEFWQLRKSMKDANKMDYEKLNDANLNLELKKAELDKEYYLKFKKILSAEKIYNLYKAEKDFQKELLGRIQRKG